MKNKVFKILTAALFGALTGLALLFPKVGFLVFLTPVAAFYVIGKQAENKSRFFYSALFSLGFCLMAYLPAFSISTTLPPTLNFFVTAGIYVLISLVHGAVYTAAVYFSFSLPSFFGTRFLYVASFFTAAEWLLGAGPFAWPTARISLALYKFPALIRLSSVGGQLMVSFLVIAVAALLSEALVYLKNRRVILCAAAVALFVFNIIFGITAEMPDGKYATVSVVQSGATVIDWQRGDVFEKTLELLKTADEADLYILPESVLPNRFDVTPNYKTRWRLSALGKECLVGGRSEGHSAAYHLFEENIFGVGTKSREVPIFENGLGGRELYLLPREYEGVFHTGIGTVGTLICYESLFSSVVREAVKEDAVMLAVLTNDSWFDSVSAKNLHLAHGVFRAVESGRTLVQAGLNGHSAIIDRNGNMSALETGSGAVLTGQVFYEVKNTVYNIIGDWWLLLMLAAVGLISVIKEKGKQ